MSPLMLIELLREVSRKIGSSVKVCPKELKAFILDNVSTNMKKELLENLEGQLVPVFPVESSSPKLWKSL